MPDKVFLSLVFHNHQPVGNFDFVFREAFEKSYLPLVAALERHPEVNATLHFTGPLRDWLLDNEPEYYLDRVGALVKRGQVELLGGAYYEPILVMLDDADKIGQIRKLSDALDSDFGVHPRGIWLAERVWEPHLARPIAQAGLEYAVVDDTHFHFAGFRDEDLYGYYMTEEQGYPLRIFPAAKRMRNSMPWRPVNEFLAQLRAVHQDPTTRGHPLFVAADDGEKFGLWPGTYRLCWEEGWINQLFLALAASVDWLATVTPAQYLDEFPAVGRAYLPTASYLEMTEWALPAEGAAELPRARALLQSQHDKAKVDDPMLAAHLESVQRYLRGGLWRNFLVKYPEVNHMQKRSLYTSRRIHNMPDGDAKDRALAHLWAAQCNCGYWHGLFGGIYLYHIRAANYTNLLNAEALILDNRVEVETLDFDMDSQTELVINSQPFSFVVDLPRGGAIIEWDDLPGRYNLLNIMTRRREGYHTWLADAAADDGIITPEHPNWHTPQAYHTRAKERGLENHLIVDQHRRGTLVDHFLDEATTLESFSRVEYDELGDFVDQPYQLEVQQDAIDQATITLTRDGTIRRSEECLPLRVCKAFTVTTERVLPVTYTLTNTGKSPLDLRFGVETAYGFDGGDSDLCGLRLHRGTVVRGRGHMGLTGRHENARAYDVYTEIRHFRVNVTLDDAVELWHFPLSPVTMSEAGYERIHQGAVFLHLYRVALQPGQSWETGLRFEITTI